MSTKGHFKDKSKDWNSSLLWYTPGPFTTYLDLWRQFPNVCIKRVICIEPVLKTPYCSTLSSSLWSQPQCTVVILKPPGKLWWWKDLELYCGPEQGFSCNQTQRVQASLRPQHLPSSQLLSDFKPVPLTHPDPLPTDPGSLYSGKVLRLKGAVSYVMNLYNLHWNLTRKSLAEGWRGETWVLLTFPGGSTSEAPDECMCRYIICHLGKSILKTWHFTYFFFHVLLSVWMYLSVDKKDPSLAFIHILGENMPDLNWVFFPSKKTIWVTVNSHWGR